MILSLVAYSVATSLLALALRPKWPTIRGRGGVAAAIVAIGAGVCCADAAPAGPERALHAVVMATMAVAALTDIVSGLIYDRSLIVAGALVAMLVAADGGAVRAVAGAAISVAPFGAIYLLTRKRGMGFGDVKLAALAGLGLGTASLMWTAAGFILGAVWAVAGLLAGRLRRGQPVAFAPFMAAGVGVALIFPESGSWLIG